jgi:microcin C transport system substrate-binding protein
MLRLRIPRQLRNVGTWLGTALPSKTHPSQDFQARGPSVSWLTLGLAAVLATGVLTACEQKKAASGPTLVLFPVPALDTTKLLGELDPLADRRAVEQGEINLWGSGFPQTLNYWLDPNSFSAEMMGYLYEPLGAMRSDTNLPVGILAQSWEQSADGLTFTLKLRPEAKWSDGKSIVAADVQTYYDVLMNPKHLTPIPRVELARFERPVVVDSLTVQIKAKEAHALNFWSVLGFMAFPSHVWAQADFNKIQWDFPVVSGPYQIKQLVKEQMITLEKRQDWWGRALGWNAYKYNFQRLKFRFTEDRMKVLELLKKGDVDILPIYTASHWAKNTEFPSQAKGWVAKQRIYNKEPIGFQGFAFNLRKERFQDLRVRQALALLLNRQALNEKFMFSQYFLLDSYYPDLYPNNNNPAVADLSFDAAKARALLAEARWTVGADGLLAKDGKVFEIEFLKADDDTRHLEFYLQDLKKVGIRAKITRLSYAAQQERLDKRDFDMHWTAYGAGRLRDPEAQWISTQADVPNSGNLTGFKDPKADLIIQSLKVTTDPAKRDDLMRELDQILVAQMPMVLLWQADHHRLLWWEKFGMPNLPLGKYLREEAVPIYWWVDSEALQKLQAAQGADQSLPLRPLDLKWGL